MSDDVPTTWAYEGEDRNSEDESSNIQFAKAGNTINHDIFDLRTLLPGPWPDGQFKVKVQEDDSIRLLTRCQFQEAAHLGAQNEATAE
eukprot:1579391-Pleurochrysis_carterae.AAC.1